MANLWEVPECLYPLKLQSTFLFSSSSTSVTTETREVYCYELKCVPTNTYIEVLAPSSADCDCIWRGGPKEVIKVMWGTREDSKLIWLVSL